jgi:hypothetical protein
MLTKLDWMIHFLDGFLFFSSGYYQIRIENEAESI